MYPALYYFKTEVILTSETYVDLSKTPINPTYTNFIRRLHSEFESKRWSKGVVPGGQVIITNENKSNPALNIPAVKNYIEDVFSNDNLEEINRFAYVLALSEFKSVFEYIPFSKNTIKINLQDNEGLNFQIQPILKHPFNNWQLKMTFKSSLCTVLREREHSNYFIFSVIETNEFASDSNAPNKDVEKDIWVHKNKIERHRVAGK